MTDSLKSFLDNLRDGVFYIGHASALARIDGKLVLFDPVWQHSPYGNYWFFAPEQINCDEILDQIHCCFISHIHEDHVCLPILEKLKCPIHIMANRPNLEDRLSKCKEVRKHPPFVWCTHDDLLDFYFVPHAFNSIDSSVFVRSSQTEFCVYHGNDNFLIEEVLKNIKPDVPRVDVAMVPYAFIHWYPHLMKNMTEEERKAEARRLNKQSLEQANMFCHYLNPKHVIPFGASLFYNGGPDHPLNINSSSPFDLKKHVGPRIAGEWITISKTTMLHSLPCGLDQEKYEDFIHTSLIYAHIKYHPQASNVYVGQSHLYDIVRKISKATPEQRVKNHEIIVNDIVIDLEHLTVRRGPFGVKPYHHFEFGSYEFGRWLNGLITFEQAIGTRQFVCSRVPNKYEPRVFDFMNNFL